MEQVTTILSCDGLKCGYKEVIKGPLDEHEKIVSGKGYGTEYWIRNNSGDFCTPECLDHYLHQGPLIPDELLTTEPPRWEYDVFFYKIYADPLHKWLEKYVNRRASEGWDLQTMTEKAMIFRRQVTPAMLTPREMADEKE